MAHDHFVMTRAGTGGTISPNVREDSMATSLAPETRSEAWAEPRATPGGDPLSTRAQWLWTLLGLALLGGFLAFVVDDFPLRSLISTR